MHSSRLAVRCVLFDAVGTLIHADPPVAEVYRRAGRRHGLEVSAAELHRRFAAALGKVFGDRGATDAERERRRWRAVVCDVFREHPAPGGSLFDELWHHFAQPASWKLYDDVPEALAQMQAAGLRLGVASNFDDRLAGVCRGHRPLADLPLFCASSIGFSKPDRRFFEAVRRRHNLAPAEVLLVGDHPEEDVGGAAAAGWQAIRIDRGAKADGPNAATSAVIRSFSELPALLAATRQA